MPLSYPELLEAAQASTKLAAPFPRLMQLLQKGPVARTLTRPRALSSMPELAGRAEHMVPAGVPRHLEKKLTRKMVTPRQYTQSGQGLSMSQAEREALLAKTPAQPKVTAMGREGVVAKPPREGTVPSGQYGWVAGGKPAGGTAAKTAPKAEGAAKSEGATQSATPPSQNQLPTPMGMGAMVGIPMAAGATIGSVTADPGESMQGALRGAMVGGAMGGGAMLGGRRLFQQLGKRFKGMEKVRATASPEEFQALRKSYDQMARPSGRIAKGFIPRISAGAVLGGGAGLAGQHMLFGGGGSGPQAPAQTESAYDPQTLAYYQQMGYL